MTDLIERLEKATGPSRDLFIEAFYACFGKPSLHLNDEVARWASYLRLLDAGAWLDAAMTLMKPGDYDFTLARTTRGGPEFTEWQARIALDEVKDDPDETGPQALGEANTPALACCIAFIKSRSVSEGKS